LGCAKVFRRLGAPFERPTAPRRAARSQRRGLGRVPCAMDGQTIPNVPEDIEQFDALLQDARRTAASCSVERVLASGEVYEVRGGGRPGARADRPTCRSFACST
jgi:hypothetical protein